MTISARDYIVCDERAQTAKFLQHEWPPLDSQTLYDWGRTRLADIGKQTCLRAVLAAYELQRLRVEVTDYDRSARRAAEQWALAPTEENRKQAGRIAGMETQHHSCARGIAHIAGSRKRWPTAIGVNLTGNPRYLPTDRFRSICQAIEAELLAWATGRSDPVADRYEQGE